MVNFRCLEISEPLQFVRTNMRLKQQLEWFTKISFFKKEKRDLETIVEMENWNLVRDTKSFQ